MSDDIETRRRLSLSILHLNALYTSAAFPYERPAKVKTPRRKLAKLPRKRDRKKTP